LEGSGHFGKGQYFVAEADEYATDPLLDLTPKFLWQMPSVEIITNIELDHPDIYSSVEEIYNAYLKFSKNIKNGGLLIANGDDEYCKAILHSLKINKISFGKGMNNDLCFSDVDFSGDQTTFRVSFKGKFLGDVRLNVTGEHNVRNALAAIAVGIYLKIPFTMITKALLSFKGSKRRMEYLGKLPSGALVFDDYAHHPTEIKSTLEAFAGEFKNTKITLFFQPHTYSRTKKLFDQFVSSLGLPYKSILLDIFPSAREKEDLSVSSEMLVKELIKNGKSATYMTSISDVVKYINSQRYTSSDLLVSMGAGDIYKIWENIILQK
jgi:UDP-N-acetylmuramate--alanine ligase